MAKEIKSIDVANLPELLRIAEEVNSTNEARVLRRAGEDLAILLPARRRRPRSRSDKAMSDHDAFLASFGGWKDLIDADAFTAYLAERRRGSVRPPVEL